VVIGIEHVHGEGGRGRVQRVITILGHHQLQAVSSLALMVQLLWQNQIVALGAVCKLCSRPRARPQALPGECVCPRHAL
jgi:hypothetical protein